MIVVSFLLLLFACSVIADGTSEPEKTFLIPELEQLAKILGPQIAEYPQFYSDFHTESARRNVSIGSYAKTCFGEYPICSRICYLLEFEIKKKPLWPES